MLKNKIAYWAKEKGKRHNYLAKCCEVSPQTFSSWVKNKTQPDLFQSYILKCELRLESMEELIEEEK
jgi:putative transcriptional regulator